MTCGHEPDSAAAPPPPQQVVAETVMGQISDILAAGDGDDASSKAFAAKRLFAFLVSTSENVRLGIIINWVPQLATNYCQNL